MRAPVYPPASAFAPPERLARTLSVGDTPISVLRGIPEAWAIVIKELPSIDRRTGGEQIRPHLGNFSLASLLVFGVVPRDVLDRIDPQLQALGKYK